MAAGAPVGARPTYFQLAKLTSKDNIEDVLFAFKKKWGSHVAVGPGRFLIWDPMLPAQSRSCFG